MIAAAFKAAENVLAAAAPQEQMVAHTGHQDVDKAAQVAKTATLKMADLQDARLALASNDPIMAGSSAPTNAASDPSFGLPSWTSGVARLAMGVFIPGLPDFGGVHMSFAAFAGMDVVDQQRGQGTEVTIDQPTQYLNATPSAKSGFAQAADPIPAAPVAPAANDAAFTVPSFASQLDSGISAGAMRAFEDEAIGAEQRSRLELDGALSVLATDEDKMAEYASFADGLAGHVTALQPDRDFMAQMKLDQNPVFRPATLTMG
ncbi:MAG: hypothetical protein V4621_02275 [Pseudomonadota bacterium]